MLRLYGLCFLLLYGAPAFSQKMLNLEQCVQTALENNLNIQQVMLTQESATINYTQSKLNFLPNLNAYLSLNKGIGTQVDNFTQQIAQSPTTVQPGFSTQVTLFNGLTNWNTLKLRELEVAASQTSLEAMRNTIRMNVASTYFLVLFDQENLLVTETRLGQLEKQQEKLERLLEAGTITLGDLLSLKAQISTEKVNRLNLQNQLNRDKLTLIQYLELDAQEDFSVQPLPSDPLDLSAAIPDAYAVYEAALNTLPEIREKKMQIMVAQYRIKNAKAAFFPSLTAGFGAGTFFSSNAREVLGYNPQTFQVQYGNTVPMFDQFDNNFGSSVSFSLNVPIFNRYSARQALRISQVQQKSAELELAIQENTTLKVIVQAVQDVRAAKAKFLATQDQLVSLEESLRYAQNKYNEGLMDFYSYFEILNQKTSAENQLTSAKYDYLLKLNILNIYQGKPLSF